MSSTHLDFWFPLRYSIAIVAGIAGTAGLLLLRYNLAHYATSMIEAESWSETSDQP